MSLPLEVKSCAVCPRLCRDVCPVGVHAWRDDLIPSEKMRAVASMMGEVGGVAALERLLACTDCRACTEHCLLAIPVAAWLDASRQRWAQEREEALPPHPEPAPELPVFVPGASIGPAGLFALATCAGAPDGCRAELQLDQGPEVTRTRPEVGARRDDPWPGLADLGARRHEPPMGSTCCGQRLRAGVGDPELADRMARAMVAGIPDGATVVVADGACGAHLQRAVGGRLRLLRLPPEEGAP